MPFVRKMGIAKLRAVDPLLSFAPFLCQSFPITFPKRSVACQAITRVCGRVENTEYLLSLGWLRMLDS